jgi:chromosome segregation protein
MREFEKELQDRESKVLELLHHLSREKNSLTELEARRKFLNDQGEKLDSELAETRGQLESSRSMVDGAQSQHDQKAQDLESRRQELLRLQEQLNTCKQQLKEGEEQARAAKEAYLSKASMLSSLKELRNQYEGFGQGVRSLMSQNSRPDGLREVVVDVIQAPAEYRIGPAAARSFR